MLYAPWHYDQYDNGEEGEIEDDALDMVAAEYADFWDEEKFPDEEKFKQDVALWCEYMKREKTEHLAKALFDSSLHSDLIARKEANFDIAAERYNEKAHNRIVRDKMIKNFGE